MVHKLAAACKERWNNLCHRHKPEGATALRVRKLLMDYPPGRSPEEVQAADTLWEQDARAAGVPFANDPVWQGKVFAAPPLARKESSGATARLPEELWLRIAELVNEGGTEEAVRAMVALRSTDRFFASIVDWFAPELFGRQVLGRRLEGRLGALPPRCRQALFGRLKESAWELSGPQGWRVLQELLPAMDRLEKLTLAGFDQRQKLEVALPLGLRELTLFSFRFEDFGAWAEKLPDGLKKLSLRSGTLLAREPVAKWPSQLLDVELHRCSMAQDQVLDLASLRHLQNCTVSPNLPSANENLRLPPQLGQASRVRPAMLRRREIAPVGAASLLAGTGELEGLQRHGLPT